MKTGSDDAQPSVRADPSLEDAGGTSVEKLAVTDLRSQQCTCLATHIAAYNMKTRRELPLAPTSIRPSLLFSFLIDTHVFYWVRTTYW
jgi:hypothetical protein